jgi:hypothetical protein
MTQPAAFFCNAEIVRDTSGYQGRTVESGEVRPEDKENANDRE